MCSIPVAIFVYRRHVFDRSYSAMSSDEASDSGSEYLPGTSGEEDGDSDSDSDVYDE